MTSWESWGNDVIICHGLLASEGQLRLLLLRKLRASSNSQPMFWITIRLRVSYLYFCTWRRGREGREGGREGEEREVPVKVNGQENVTSTYQVGSVFPFLGQAIYVTKVTILVQ